MKCNALRWTIEKAKEEKDPTTGKTSKVFEGRLPGTMAQEIHQFVASNDKFQMIHGLTEWWVYSDSKCRVEVEIRSGNRVMVIFKTLAA